METFALSILISVVTLLCVVLICCCSSGIHQRRSRYPPVTIISQSHPNQPGRVFIGAPMNQIQPMHPPVYTQNYQMPYPSNNPQQPQNYPNIQPPVFSPLQYNQPQNYYNMNKN